MLENTTSTDVLLITGGTVGVSLLIFFIIQGFKDFWPGLNGRAAMGVVYLVALGVSAAVLYQADNHYNLEWVLALIVSTASLAEIAKSIYARIYGREIKVEDMSVEELNDLQRQVNREFEARVAEVIPDTE